MHHISKQFEEIQTLLDDLKRESDSESTLIIVEGSKDIRSLEGLGISKQVSQIQGRNFDEMCDYATQFKKIIILTDFDDAGQELSKKLQQNLTSRGINVDLNFYNKLKFYFKKVSKDIEGILQIYSKVQQLRGSKLKE
ncbi:MAG: toprim domain-containing protein [Candidatus Helarchaeota archaeon]|nr:toprim domain-containing protein [Candidatus Helarchaeota archaeon]